MPSHKGRSIFAISVGVADLIPDQFDWLKAFIALLSSLGYPLLDKGSSIRDIVLD
jgi:hypothetical protein